MQRRMQHYIKILNICIYIYISNTDILRCAMAYNLYNFLTKFCSVHNFLIITFQQVMLWSIIDICRHYKWNNKVMQFFFNPVQNVVLMLIRQCTSLCRSSQWQLLCWRWSKLTKYFGLVLFSIGELEIE